jgi:hypothetical protein
MRATSMSSEEVSTAAAYAGPAAADPGWVNAEDMEFSPWSRPAPSTGRPKVGSKNYFARVGGTIFKFPAEAIGTRN